MVALNQADLQTEETQIAEAVRTALQAFTPQRSSLIPILQMIQQQHGYLPGTVIDVVADYLSLSAGEVFGVATFYNQFRFHPPGRNPVKVCLGTACHVRGGDIILENFERKLEIKEGQTTADREFSIERVACVGCCALAPVALVGETLHGKMAPSKVEGLVLRIAIEREKKAREAQKANESEDDGT